MSESKHTPGPWVVETVKTSCGVCHKIGPWPHEWRHGKEMSACIYDDYPSPPEGTDTMLANARLISAAPDFHTAAAFAKIAAVALAGYEADYGEPLPDDYEIGRIEESRLTPSFRFKVGHIRMLAAAIAKAEGQT